MQGSANHYTPFGTSDLEANPTFNVVIVYEDFETGKNAKKTYDFLVENLGRECQFTNQMWKFDVLGIPKLREMAAKDAGVADIVLISCHGNAEIPVEVKAWIELWQSEESSAIALVALFSEHTTETPKVRTYLADVAKRGRMEFFGQPDPAASGAERFPFEPRAQFNQKTLATLAGVAQRDGAIPRWGINE